jgi:hypothetical protein
MPLDRWLFSLAIVRLCTSSMLLQRLQLPGLQLRQNQPALAQGQLHMVQEEAMEQKQQRTSRGVVIFCHLLPPCRAGGALAADEEWLTRSVCFTRRVCLKRGPAASVETAALKVLDLGGGCSSSWFLGCVTSSDVVSIVEKISLHPKNMTMVTFKFVLMKRGLNNQLGGGHQLASGFGSSDGVFQPMGVAVVQEFAQGAYSLRFLVAIVTVLTLSSNVTPLRVNRRMTVCKGLLGSFIVNACIWSVGLASRNFGRLLTVMSFTQKCIGQRR